MFFFEYYLEFQKKLLPRQPYGNTTLKYVHSSQKSLKNTFFALQGILFLFHFIFSILSLVLWEHFQLVCIYTLLLSHKA